MAGDLFRLADGSDAELISIKVEEAPVRTETYNLAVADFGTYFAGERGVWVHNSGGRECQRIMALHQRLVNKGDDIWAAYTKVVNRLPNAQRSLLKGTLEELSTKYKALLGAAWKQINMLQSRVQHAFTRHRTHWGFDAADNWDAQRYQEMVQRLTAHIEAPNTSVIKGLYRGQDATFHTDLNTGLSVIKTSADDLTAAFRLSKQQLMYLLKKRSVN